MTTDEEIEHGIDGGVYDNLAKLAYGSGGQILFCLCGYQTDGLSDDWQDAGAQLDEHLSATEAT